MKIGVTGYDGFVGSHLGYEPIQVDITNEVAVREAILDGNYDVIIHAAAMTDVDACEANTTGAARVNTGGVINVVNWFTGTFIYISSDHVFNGKKFFGGGYSEKHNVSPVNVYGQTKRSGETMARYRDYPTKIIRTSKLFSYSKVRDTMSKLDDGEDIVVTDVLRRSFLHVDHFVEGIRWVVENLDKTPPLLHISGTELFTYYKFYLAVARSLGINTDTLTPRNHLLKDAVARPVRGGLNVSLAKSLGVPLYSAHDGIKLL